MVRAHGPLLRRALLVALALTAGCSPQDLRTGPAETVTLLGVPPGAQEAVVVRHTDGDTLVLRGRGTGPLPGTPTKVRLLQVDTPEVTDPAECYGPQASARLRELTPVGSTVQVTADRQLKDRFGRTLLLVWNAQGESVQDVLLLEGLATVLVVRPNVAEVPHFRQVEQVARGRDAGLWGAC